MPEYRKFTKHVGIVGVAQLLIKLRGLLLVPIIVKALSASDYGVFATLTATVALLVPLSSLGLFGSMVRFLAGENDRSRLRDGFYTIFFSVFVLSLLFSVALFSLAPFLASTVFGEPAAAGVIEIGAFLVLIQTIQFTNIQFFLTVRKMFAYSAFQVMQAICELSAAAFLAYNGFGLEAIIYSFIGVDALFFVLGFCVVAADIGFGLPTFSRLGEFLSFGIPLVFSIISQWVNNVSDKYVIGFFLSSAAVGVYSAAYSIGLAVQLFINPISTALAPSATKLWEEGKMAELANHFRYSIKYFLMLAVPSCFGLSVLAGPLVTMLAKADFAADGVWIIPFVAFGTLFYGLFSLSAQIFSLMKKTDYVTYIWVTGAVINIGVNVLYVPKYGIVVAAASTLLSFFLMAVASSYYLCRQLGPLFDLRFIVKSLLASSVMAAAVSFIGMASFPEIVVPITVGAVAYFSILLLLGGFEKKEYDLLRSFLQR